MATTITYVITSGIFVPQFVPQTTTYLLADSVPTETFQPGFTTPASLCNATLGGQTFPCINGQNTVFNLTEVVQPLVLNLYIGTDSPPNITAYTFNLVETLCHIEYLNLTQFTDPITCTEPTDSSLDVFCLAASEATSVQFSSLGSTYCSNESIQYLNTAGQWVTCAPGGCLFNQGNNYYRSIFSNSVNTSAPTSVAYYNITNGIYS